MTTVFGTRPARRVSKAASFGVVLLLVASVPPSGVAADADGQADVRSGTGVAAEASVDAALQERDRLEETSRAVTDGGLVEAIGVAADLADIELGDPRLQPSTPKAATVLERVPAGLAEPVAALLAAQHEADRHVRAALPTSLETDPSNGGHSPAILRPQTTGLSDDGSPQAFHPGRSPEGAGVPIAQPAGFADVPAGIVDRLDKETMTRGALLLGAAADAAVPRLESYVEQAPTRRYGGTVEGCDVVDEPPMLCIGGEGDNLYADGDYAVHIDLGGDDVFHNAPGSADPGVLTDGNGNGLFAAVAIILSGNDTYDTENGIIAEGGDGASGVQGAGVGGIGILVDTGGDDVYRTTATRDGEGASGQGWGIAGIGVLDDRGGNDTYEVAGLADAGRASGQGGSFLGGLGILIDRGEGSDTYLASTASDPKTWRSGGVYPSPVLVQAQGSAVAGSGALFFDGGGTDEMRLNAFSRPIAPDDPREQARVVAISGALGQGYADLASGALALTGEGPTSWSLVSEGQAPWSGQRQAHGMGSASGDSFAAIYDAGGDDAYTMKTISQAQHEVAVTDDCKCFGASAAAQAGSPRQAAFSYLSVYSTGMGSGTGIILDAGGDDAYHMEGQATADAVAHDNRTQLVGDDIEEIGALATADASYVTMIGQGSGGGLWDVGGNDAYSFHVNAEAEAKAKAQLEDAHETAKAGTGDVRGYAQGAGGQLFDLGGADRYDARTLVSATADPPDTVEPGPRVLQAQPGGGGLLIDADRGADDVFSTMPATEPCQGQRGDEAWIECDGGVGVNVAPAPSQEGMHR